MTSSEADREVYVSDVPMLFPPQNLANESCAPIQVGREACGQDQARSAIVYGMFINKAAQVKHKQAIQRKRIAKMRRVYGFHESGTPLANRAAQEKLDMPHPSKSPDNTLEGSSFASFRTKHSDLGLARSGLDTTSRSASGWHTTEVSHTSPSPWTTNRSLSTSSKWSNDLENGCAMWPGTNYDTLDPRLVPNVNMSQRSLVGVRPGASLWRLHGVPTHSVGRDPSQPQALHPAVVPSDDVSTVMWNSRTQPTCFQRISLYPR